eukprot:s1793_g3.t1
MPFEKQENAVLKHTGFEGFCPHWWWRPFCGTCRTSTVPLSHSSVLSSLMQRRRAGDRFFFVFIVWPWPCGTNFMLEGQGLIGRAPQNQVDTTPK